MSENSTIPVRSLRSVIGARWRRTRLFTAVGDQPIFHLVRPVRPDDLTTQLDGHLGSGVPHALISAGQSPPGDELDRSVLLRNELLDKVVLELGRHDSRRWQGRLRFRRYALASYLLQHNEEPPEPDEVPNRQVHDLLSAYVQERVFRRKNRAADGENGASTRLDATVNRLEPLGLPWYLTLPAVLLSWVVPPAIRRGVVLRQPRRWFMRQRYLSPRESADFASFAQRLLSNPSVHENAQQVRKFLVHALLEDLADAYARRAWRWRWVRRDNYPVLLLQGVAPGTTGELLIGLINDVRNETGARDPLLVVASGPRELPRGSAPTEPMTVQGWQKQLLDARRRRSSTAWYLPIRVEDPPTDVEPRPAFPRAQFPVRTTRSRMLRVVPVAIAVLVVLGAGVAYLHEWHAHCREPEPWLHPDLITVEDGGPCVGFSAGHRFADDIEGVEDEHEAADDRSDARREVQEALAAAEAEIASTNDRFDRETPADATIPTVYYLGALSYDSHDRPALQGIVEELKGVKKAQDVLNDGKFPVKVIVANGGKGMREGERVARRIAAHARAAEASRSPVLGVIGMGGSRDSTEATIRVLTRASLPMIGTTNSLDDLPAHSPLFFQVSPLNRWEAEVVARYLESGIDRPVDHVTIFGDGDDPYSENLATDLAARLGPARSHVEWHEPGPATVPCAAEDAIFFAGRAGSLPALLSTVRRQCRRDDRPQLIAGDDSSKFSLDETLLTRYPDRIDYVSFTGPAAESGREALANDALQLFELAHDNTRTEEGDAPPLDGGRIWAGLRVIGPEQPLRGDSGDIGFAAGEQWPTDKAVWILSLVSGEPAPVHRYVCGRHPLNTAADGCRAFPEDP